MTFSNPLLGGGNKLIREEIMSPNFVANVSGWVVRKDGSAEFNNVTVRGDLIVSGNSGSYLLAESDFGIPKLFFRTADDGVLDSDKLPGQIYATNGVNYMVLSIFSPVYAVGTADNQAVLTLKSATSDGSLSPEITMGANNLALPKLRVRMNGDVTIEESLVVNGTFSRAGCVASFGTPSIATATPTTLTLTAIQDSYSMISGTTITIPTTGTYEVGMVPRFAAQAVAAGIRQVNFRTNGVVAMQTAVGMSATYNTVDVAVPLMWHGNYTAGDTIDFRVNQTSGGALSLIAGSRAWVRMVEG